MIRLLALRAFIAAWARAISLSDKLSERTWKLLVVIQCVILILAAGGLRESRLSSPFPSDITVPRDFPQDDSSLLNPPVNPRRRAIVVCRNAAAHTLPSILAARRMRSLARMYAKRTKRPLIVTSSYRTPAEQARAIRYRNVRAYSIPFLLNVYRSRADIREVVRVHVLNRSESQETLSELFPVLRRFVEPARSITVQLSQSEDGGDYKKALLFWVSLFGLIVSPVSAASTAVVAWISVHRSRADALLKQMQIEKMRLEMEQLRVELEQTRLEAERHQSRVVLVAG